MWGSCPPTDIPGPLRRTSAHALSALIRWEPAAEPEKLYRCVSEEEACPLTPFNVFSSMLQQAD